MIDTNRPQPAHDSPEHFVSLLGDIYAAYDRQLFLETLADWGWCGPLDQRPSWLDEYSKSFPHAPGDADSSRC
jgi:hypothetical protein